jgi:hypothetical protein
MANTVVTSTVAARPAFPGAKGPAEMRVRIVRPDRADGPWLIYSEALDIADFIDAPLELRSLILGRAAWFEAERHDDGWDIKAWLEADVADA